jgi:hypothetical protein
MAMLTAHPLEMTVDVQSLMLSQLLDAPCNLGKFGCLCARKGNDKDWFCMALNQEVPATDEHVCMSPNHVVDGRVNDSPGTYRLPGDEDSILCSREPLIAVVQPIRRHVSLNTDQTMWMFGPSRCEQRLDM